MSYPEDFLYSKEHEWIKKDGDCYLIGITEFAQSELGEIVFVELPEVGSNFSQGDSICVVESTKAASDVYSAVGGEVAEVNSKLADNPELINESPHKDGWLIKLKGVNESELSSLMNAGDYQSMLDSDT